MLSSLTQPPHHCPLFLLNSASLFTRLGHVLHMSLIPSSPSFHFLKLLSPSLQHSSESPSFFLHLSFSQSNDFLSLSVCQCVTNLPDAHGNCILCGSISSFSPSAATCRIHWSTSHICSSSLQQARTPTYCTHTHTQIHTHTHTNIHLKLKLCGCVDSCRPEFSCM